MLHFVLSVVLGVFLFVALLVVAVRIVLEKLTQKNFEFIKEWQKLSTGDKMNQLDQAGKDRRKAQGLAHRRKKETLFGLAKTRVVVTCGLFNRACVVEFRKKQMLFMDEAKKSVELLSVAITEDLLLDEDEDGAVVILGEHVSAQDEMVSGNTIRVGFVDPSEKAEWKEQVQRAAVAKDEPPKPVVAEEKDAPPKLEDIETDTLSSKKPEIPFDAIKDSGVDVCQADFLNKFLWRFFQEMSTSYVFEEKLRERIEIQLKKQLNKSKEAGKWPAILKGLKFNRIFKGNGFITAHSVKVDKVFSDGSLMAQVDAEYQGGAGVSIGTTAVLAPFGRTLGYCDIEIVVRLLHIRTLLYVYMPRNFKEKFSLLFEKFPEQENVKFGVEVFLGKRKVALVSHFDVVSKFAQSLVMRLMCRSLVYPSRLRFYLPYPGRKPQAKVQRFLTPSEMQKRELKRSKSSSVTKSVLGPDGTVLKPTMKQLRDSRKNAQRKKSALEFFEKILQQQQPQPAPLASMCVEEIEVYGFSDMDWHISGTQAFLIALTDLRRRFQNLNFLVEEDAVVEEGVLVTWCLRGTQIAKVWSKYPSNPPVETSYRGSTLFSFDSFGKIVSMENFWVLA